MSSPGRRIAFVTGASYGIGAACAFSLAKDGYDVAVTATRLENLKATCERLESLGARAFPIALDVRSHGAVRGAIERAAGALGEIDVLVNNAGVTQRKSALDTTPEEWNNIIATNLSGAFFVSQEFGRRSIEHKRPGCIINVSSTFAIIGVAQRAPYGTSKAGVSQLTRMLAIEWAEHDIRVNAIAPGRVETGSPHRADTAADPAYVQAARAAVPLKRFCTVEDCAEAVRYLAGPQSGYITGQTIVLDGGLTVV